MRRFYVEGTWRYDRRGDFRRRQRYRLYDDEKRMRRRNLRTLGIQEQRRTDRYRGDDVCFDRM